MTAHNVVEFDIQDEFGNLDESGTRVVTWRDEVSAALPQVYADYANTTPLGNPFSIAPGISKVKFYSPPGRYRLDVSDGLNSAVRRDYLVGTSRGLDVEDVQLMIDSSIFADKPVTDGIVVVSSGDLLARAIVGQSGKIEVADGDGVSGDPSLTIGDDIADLAVSDQLSALTEKVSLNNNDLFLIEDSAAGGAKKRVKKLNIGAASNVVASGAPNSSFGINSLTDVTILSFNIANVAAGDCLEVEVRYAIANNSGSSRTFTDTLNFGSLASVISRSTGSSGTTKEVNFLKSVVSIAATNYAHVMTEQSHQGTQTTAGGANNSVTPQMSWNETSSDLTGTLAFSFKVKSSNTSATQTLILYSYVVRKVPAVS